MQFDGEPQRLRASCYWGDACWKNDWLVMLAIYHNPDDFPGRWVMRPFVIAKGRPGDPRR